MNGRVYDPEVARFLSADPFVQFPGSTQGYNRYAYVNNNPMSYSDPSGYLLVEAMAIAGSIASAGATAKTVYATIGFASAASGIAGYIESGRSVKAGFVAAAGTALSGSIGFKVQNAGWSAVKATTLGAIGGGALSAAGGGRFGDGFLGGIAGGVMAPLARGNALLAAIVGGTVSTIGGGKFGNGAIGSAFAYTLGWTQFHNVRAAVNGEYVRGTIADVSADEARRRFEALKADLVKKGVPNAHKLMFVNKWALSSGKATLTTDSFEKFLQYQ
jgi:hypothetical protein